MKKIILTVLIASSVLLSENVFSQQDTTIAPCIPVNYSELPIDDGLKCPFTETICRWMGTPYHYTGGTKKGIDCSGFVSVLFKTVFNIDLGASSKDIYSENILPLKKNNLLPSDLVFFRIRKKRISHVGVYLGNIKFVHATVKQGVIVSDLNEPYYKKCFFHAGRVKE